MNGPVATCSGHGTYCGEVISLERPRPYLFSPKTELRLTWIEVSPAPGDRLVHAFPKGSKRPRQVGVRATDPSGPERPSPASVEQSHLANGLALSGRRW